MEEFKQEYQDYTFNRDQKCFQKHNDSLEDLSNLETQRGLFDNLSPRRPEPPLRTNIWDLLLSSGEQAQRIIIQKPLRESENQGERDASPIEFETFEQKQKEFLYDSQKSRIIILKDIT